MKWNIWNINKLFTNKPCLCNHDLYLRTLCVLAAKVRIIKHEINYMSLVYSVYKYIHSLVLLQNIKPSVCNTELWGYVLKYVRNIINWQIWYLPKGSGKCCISVLCVLQIPQAGSQAQGVQHSRDWHICKVLSLHQKLKARSQWR